MSNPPPYVVMSENEFVRVVQVDRRARQSTERYTPIATPLVRVIFESDDPRLKPGSTHWCETPPDDSGRFGREIRIELKAAPSISKMKLDAVRLDPARYQIDFENQRVRIVRLGFGPHEQGLMVEHPPRVLVTLTDVDVKLLFADGRTDRRSAPAGVAAWLDGETLQTENAGVHPLEVVLIEPKAPGADFNS